MKAIVLSRFVSQSLVPFMGSRNKDDLATMCELIEAGKVTPVIDRRDRLSEAADAFRYMEAGHARGKVVITMNGDPR